MKKTIFGFLLFIFAVVAVADEGFRQHGADYVNHASSLVSRHLLAFENEPGLDLSSYLVRGEGAEKALAADLLEMQAADGAGAEEQKNAAIAFSSRALSVIRTYTKMRMANVSAGLTDRRVLEAERVWPLQTKPELKEAAFQRLQVARQEHQQALLELNHQRLALGMQCELLLGANETVKTVFGNDKGLDAQTREFVKQFD